MTLATCHSRCLRLRSTGLLAAMLLAVGCSSSTGGESTSIDSQADQILTDLADDLAAVEPIDRRPELLSSLGAPESFVLSVGSVNGVASRYESWQYWSSRTQVDLVDGEIAFNVGLGAVPDGTLLPLDYAPNEFVLLATVDEVQASLVGVELTEVEGAADDLGLPGARTFAAEQLLLAFVDDLLVYVQTFPLLPEEA